MNGDAVPIVKIGLSGLDQFKFLLGIVDEGTEFFFLRLSDIVAEKLVHFSFDISRCILQHMSESLALTVDIGQKMLGTLGQGHDGLEVNDLRRGSRNRWERL